MKKINIKNTEQIQAMLDAVNGRATSWTITEAEDVKQMALDAEKVLKRRGLLKRDQTGVRVYHETAGPSYSKSCTWNKAKGGAITLEKLATGWFCVAYKKTEIRAREEEHTSYRMSDEQRANLKN